MAERKGPERKGGRTRRREGGVSELLQGRLEWCEG
jgi:hypothetical protein